MNWSFYDPASGMFVGRTFSGHPSMLKANTPAGLLAIEGAHDHLSQRVDLETGEVVDYQPPSPGPDYEWFNRRWILSAAAAAREATRRETLSEIAELERRQPRVIREVMLGVDPEATARLAKIESDIVALRAKLTP